MRNTDFRLVLLHSLRFGNGVSSGRKKLRGSEIEDLSASHTGRRCR